MPRRMTKRERREVARIARANWKAILAILILIAILVAVAYYMGWIDLLYLKWFGEDEDPVLSTAGGYETVVDEFGELRVNFLDVGQADCVIIELPDGKNMIIDSGDNNADQTVISNFTTANNITKFDYLLLTHQDSDHAGNMDWVLETYQVNFIFKPNTYSSHSSVEDLPESINPKYESSEAFVSTTKTYADFLIAAHNEGCTVEVFNKDSDFENTLICGEERRTYNFDFLTPTASRQDIKYDNPNDYSPIFVLEYSGRIVMFNGDAEEEALEEYITTYSGQYDNVDVLKVGHHGSSNASSTAFYNAVDPEYAVIMCGLGNKYGHPHQEVLDMITSHGDMNVYRTDTNGTISLEISSSGNMSWNMDRTDTTYNLTCGADMPETLNYIKVVEDNNDFIITILNDCVVERKRVVA